MDDKQNTDALKAGDKLERKTIPTISVAEDTNAEKMGDMEKELKPSDSDVPFSNYKDSDTNSVDSKLVEDDDNFNADTKGIQGLLKTGLKLLDVRSEGGQPGSRKVSFHSDVGSQPNSRKVSQTVGDGGYIQPLQYLHPVYSGIPLAPNYRRISAQPFGYYSEVPPSRKTSAEVFYYPQVQHMPKYSQHGKVSVFSIGNSSDTGTIGGDPTETIPDLQHYRVSVFDNQRPTLYQLREDEQVRKSLREQFNTELNISISLTLSFYEAYIREKKSRLLD